MLDLLAELRGLPEVSLSVLMRSRFTGWYDLPRPQASAGEEAAVVAEGMECGSVNLDNERSRPSE